MLSGKEALHCGMLVPSPPATSIDGRECERLLARWGVVADCIAKSQRRFVRFSALRQRDQTPLSPRYRQVRQQSACLPRRGAARLWRRPARQERQRHRLPCSEIISASSAQRTLSVLLRSRPVAIEPFRKVAAPKIISVGRLATSSRCRVWTAKLRRYNPRRAMILGGGHATAGVIVVVNSADKANRASHNRCSLGDDRGANEIMRAKGGQ